MGISRRKALGIFGGGAVLAATASRTAQARDKPNSVAIIGGGISGLSVAYNLVRCGFKGKITVVEKSPTLGGNAATAEVILGTDFRGAGDIQPFVRFADLGVNDVNLQSYVRLKEAMDYIHYSTDKYLRPLEDTVTHFTPDFKEIWTKDGYLTGQAEPYTEKPIDDRRGVVDTRHSLHIEDAQLADDERSFMLIAADDFNRKNHFKPPEWWDLTVAAYVEFFKKYRLSKTKISSENLKRLVRLFLYPRISAMYFADDSGPQNMPMLGVMSYYSLQEGIGITDPKNGTEPDRRYFTHGSQHWIEELARWLETNDENQVEILRGFEAALTGNSKHGVSVINLSENSSALDARYRTFDVDQVVMAGHADHQLHALKPEAITKRDSTADPLLSTTMEQYLSSVQHSESQAYAHTWNRLLPPDPGSWRTYNVTIRDQKQRHGLQSGYQMTYVQNRHRNDRQNKTYNQYALPVYFVSLNPQEKIPDEYILRRTQKDKIQALKRQEGYGRKLNADDPEAQLAKATFRHTVMTSRLLEIQQDLHNHQGMADGRVFFAGCWTNGAGLHEECFAQAEHVVDVMLGKSASDRS